MTLTQAAKSLSILTTSVFFGLALSGCRHDQGYDGHRRQSQLFQVAGGPVVVYPVDPNRLPRDRENFMLPPRATMDFQLQPISPGPLQDLQPLAPSIPPRTRPSTPKPVAKSNLPQRGVRVRLSKRDVQFLLKELGNYRGALDGEHGPQTKRAIKDFQTKHGLVVDGVAGPKTQKTMVKALQDLYKKNARP